MTRTPQLAQVHFISVFRRAVFFYNLSQTVQSVAKDLKVYVFDIENYKFSL
jgi:hypothetical protein